MAFVLKGPARFGFYLCTVLLALFSLSAFGHTIEGSDASFVETIDGPAIFPFMYLGAKHMVTGYDHLLFLVGVIFFLYRPKHVVQYVTLFAIGHSITLLFGVLADLQVNAYIIDAIVFGLFHGLGLATKLQEFDLSENGLVTNIISFNIGVEIGQILALSAVYIMLSIWRSNASFLRHAFITNTALMTGGFMLVGFQLSAFFLQSPY